MRGQSFYQEGLVQVCPSLTVSSLSVGLSHTPHMVRAHTGLKVGWANTDPTVHREIGRGRFLPIQQKFGYAISRQGKMMSFFMRQINSTLCIKSTLYIYIHIYLLLLSL